MVAVLDGEAGTVLDAKRSSISVTDGHNPGESEDATTVTTVRRTDTRGLNSSDMEQYKGPESAECSTSSHQRDGVAISRLITTSNPSTSANSLQVDVPANKADSYKESSTIAKSNLRRKLSKQNSVDDSWPSIFIGTAEDDYFEPAKGTESEAKVSAFYQPPPKEVARSASIDVVKKDVVVTTVLADRSHSSSTVTIDYPPDSAITTKSSARYVPGCSADDSTLIVPAMPAHDNSTTSSSSIQAVCVGKDDVDSLPHVSEIIPIRCAGDTTMDHPCAGISSRTKQLVRSMAMCGDDDTRLRPPPSSSMKSYASVAACGTQGRNRNSSSLSRESSFTDYAQDLTEIELQAFIAATLHKNPRDRTMILDLEQTFNDFLNNFGEQSMKLPPSSSYNRMLIHRVAVLFGLDHNVDNSGRCVVVSKTASSKPPPFVFASLIQSNIFTDSRRYYNGAWSYGESRTLSTGEQQRNVLPFDVGYSGDNCDSINQTTSWIRGNQRSFEKQPLFHPRCPEQTTTIRKAGSFSGVPAFYRTNSGTLENCDLSANDAARRAPSLASCQSTHLSPRQAIDEATERLNNISFSDRTSQISFRSSCSNSHLQQAGVYVGYPPAVAQYQIGDETAYAPCQQSQQLYVSQTPVVSSATAHVYSQQPTLIVPVQHNQPLQSSVPLLSCVQPTDPVTNAQVTQAQLMSIQQPVEYVQYPMHQCSAQVLGRSPQQYQPIAQASYPAMYQHVVYQPYEQIMQQPLMQSVHSSLPNAATQFVVQSSSQYMPAVYPCLAGEQIYQASTGPSSQLQHQIVAQAGEHGHYVNIQSPAYQHSPQRMAFPAMVTAVPQLHPHHLDARVIQHPRPTYQEDSTAKMDCGMPCTEGISEVVDDGEVAVASEIQCCAVAPHADIISAQLGHGKSVLNPLSVFVQPEPMYHYSQSSPIMSSMQQQQQMMQIQCHSRPLLYRSTNPCTHCEQGSIDGGYYSMTRQDSIRESDVAAADSH